VLQQLFRRFGLKTSSGFAWLRKDARSHKSLAAVPIVDAWVGGVIDLDGSRGAACGWHPFVLRI